MADYATGKPLNPRVCPAADYVAILCARGFTAESAWQAVTLDDETLLRHSGTITVQLDPPRNWDDPGSAGVLAKV